MYRLCISFVFVVCGLLVFLVGGYLTAMSPGARTTVKIALPALLLLATYVFGRSERFLQYRKAVLGFFIASVGFLTAHFFGNWLPDLFDLTTETIQGIAVTKLSESVMIVAPILLLTKVAGDDMGSLYLKKGRFKLGLGIGVTFFFVFAVLFLLQASSLNISMSTVMRWSPWLAVFIFSNAFMEELHFRGLFVKKFEPILGRGLSNLTVTLFFTISHAPVAYTSDIVTFLGILFLLSLAWGYLMQKTDSILASMLFHAGADLVVMIGIFEAYQGD